jgi:hypothetical protein
MMSVSQRGEKMTWICDTCHETINSVDDGWFEWKSVPKADGEYGGRIGFRLVHAGTKGPNGRKGCMYNERGFAKGESLADLPLEQFVGPDGLMNLLEFLSDSPGSDELIEMIKRLHVPGYEGARLHFDRAIREGVFEPNSKPGFHSQRQIERVRTWLEEKKSD